MIAAGCVGLLVILSCTITHMTVPAQQRVLWLFILKDDEKFNPLFCVQTALDDFFMSWNLICDWAKITEQNYSKIWQRSYSEHRPNSVYLKPFFWKVYHLFFLDFLWRSSCMLDPDRNDLLWSLLWKVLAETEQVNFHRVFICAVLVSMICSRFLECFTMTGWLLCCLALLLIVFCLFIISMSSRKLWWKLPPDLRLPRSSLWSCNWRVHLSSWEDRKFMWRRYLSCHTVL